MARSIAAFPVSFPWSVAADLLLHLEEMSRVPYTSVFYRVYCCLVEWYIERGSLCESDFDDALRSCLESPRSDGDGVRYYAESLEARFAFNLTRQRLTPNSLEMAKSRQVNVLAVGDGHEEALRDMPFGCLWHQFGVFRHEQLTVVTCPQDLAPEAVVKRARYDGANYILADCAVSFPDLEKPIDLGRIAAIVRMVQSVKPDLIYVESSAVLAGLTQWARATAVLIRVPYPQDRNEFGYLQVVNIGGLPFGDLFPYSGH